MATRVDIRNDLSNAQITNMQQRESRLYTRLNSNVVQAVRNYQQVNSGINSLIFPLERPKYFMNIAYSSYSRTNLTQVNFNSVGSITLPLPLQLVDNHEVDYAEEELGMVAGGIMAGVGALSESATAEQIARQSAQAEVNNSQGWGNLAANWGLGIADSLTGTNLQSAVQAMAGYAPNKFLTILLKGPKYKQHDFSWKLVPKNKQEAETIRNIICELNNRMAPSLTGGGFLFSFPDIFHLSFHPNAGYLYKFKPAVLRNFQVNYAPGGTPAFYHTTSGGDDNAPESVELRMTFLELEFWLHSDFNTSNDPSQFRGGNRSGRNNPLPQPQAPSQTSPLPNNGGTTGSQTTGTTGPEIPSP